MKSEAMLSCQETLLSLERSRVARGLRGPATPNDARPDAHPFVKHDTGKPMWSLLPFDAVESVVRVMTFGCKKYGPGNWKKAPPEALPRLEDAMFRHYSAWKRGEAIDPESGLPHLAHMTCNALFLLWHHTCR